MSQKDVPSDSPLPPRPLAGPRLSPPGLSPTTTQLPRTSERERSRQHQIYHEICFLTTNTVKRTHTNTMFATPSSYSVTPCKSNFARIPERASNIIRDVKRRSLRTCRAKAVSEKRLSGEKYFQLKLYQSSTLSECPRH